jgi:RNA polymerase sigma-70 factor (ECF subfamily)
VAEGEEVAVSAAAPVVADLAPSERPPTPDDARESSFETDAVVRRHGDMVYRIALTHTGCVGDAEDAFQDAFLAYHRRRPEVASEEHLKAWLITTALNCSKHIQASSWRSRVGALDSAEEPVAEDSFAFATARQDEVFRALKALPADHREVLYLFYFEDLPVAAIAEQLSLQVGAAKMRLSRARKMMRDQLPGGLFDE